MLRLLFLGVESMVRRTIWQATQIDPQMFPSKVPRRKGDQLEMVSVSLCWKSPENPLQDLQILVHLGELAISVLYREILLKVCFVMLKFSFFWRSVISFGFPDKQSSGVVWFLSKKRPPDFLEEQKNFAQGISNWKSGILNKVNIKNLILKMSLCAIVCLKVFYMYFCIISINSQV